MSDISDISRRPRVVIGFSGSVATIKALELLNRIIAFADVRVVLTDHAAKFLSSAEVDLMRTICPVFTDSDEWPQQWKRGDPVLHIELRKWADVFLIAPLSANTLAKLTHGLCDNLLTCLARAWDRPTRMLVAPAMNTTMYTHPLTHEQLQTLRSRGVMIVEPVVKTLACGDTGIGAMASIDTLEIAVKLCLQHPIVDSSSASSIPPTREERSSTSMQNFASTLTQTMWGSLALIGMLIVARVYKRT